MTLKEETTQGMITGRASQEGKLYNHFIVVANGLEFNVNLERNP